MLMLCYCYCDCYSNAIAIAIEIAIAITLARACVSVSVCLKPNTHTHFCPTLCLTHWCPSYSPDLSSNGLAARDKRKLYKQWCSKKSTPRHRSNKKQGHPQKPTETHKNLYTFFLFECVQECGQSNRGRIVAGDITKTGVCQLTATTPSAKTCRKFSKLPHSGFCRRG